MPYSLIALLLSLLLVACAGTSPPTRFYRLDLVAADRLGPIGQGPSIGLAALSLPDALDRPQIVTDAGAYRVELAEFHRWAGDLKADVRRVLASGLTARLPGAQVTLFPWPRYRRLDYQLRIEVIRFDGALGGEAVLQGNWSLLDGAGEQEYALEAFALSQTVAGDEYADLVAALSQLTHRLAERIAENIVRRGAYSAAAAGGAGR